MNGHEKSDRRIVPKKPPNNGTAAEESVSGEGVEGSGRAKGSPLRSDMRRMQSRGEGMPSALERIREAAKRHKRMRFTALFHHICHVDPLRVAYEQGPGVLRLGSTARPGSTTAGTWNATSRTCPASWSEERTAPRPCDGCTSRSRTAGGLL